MQKILSLVWFKIYPPYFGGQKGIALFNRELSKYFEVDCLCSKDNDIIDDAGCRILPELPRSKTQFFNPLVWNRINSQAKKKNYDFVIIEFPYYGLLGWWLKKRKAKLIIHTHNIESERFRSFDSTGWKLLKFYEKIVLKKADVVIFKTTADREFAITNYRLDADKAFLLPYGIEKPAYNQNIAEELIRRRYDIPGDHKILLFAGTLDYAPNREAIKYITDRLIPELERSSLKFTILICGRNAKEKTTINAGGSRNIILTGFVNDIENYFAAADAFINPVQNVHGIQTKILDALSFDKTVVCFEASAAALPAYLVNSKVFAVAGNDTAAFVKAIEKAVSVNFTTPVEFFHDFSWEKIVKDFVDYLQRPAN